MGETYRLQWDRDIRGRAAVSQRIRYRRKGGPWCEVSSVEELPDDVRKAYEQARGSAESCDAASAGTLDADLPTGGLSKRHSRISLNRVGRRPPTRAREIDRTLYLDHPWFNGWTLLTMGIAAPYIAYTAWQGLHEGGWMAVFCGLMLALASLMAYYGLCVLVNSTEFRVDKDFLTVKHGPLPWSRERSIAVDRIEQLSTRMHCTRHATTYSLSATLVGSPSVQLAEGIDTAAEARSIERAIERHLGIEDWDG